MRTDDGIIIDKCLNGDSAAFGLLVDKYKEGVYALAYSKLRNFHDAEDVTQEVFINAYQKLKTLRRWDSVLGWLYSITSNLCKMQIRSQTRRPDREFIEDKKSEVHGNAWENSYREEMLYSSLHEALDSLPEIYQQALTLHYLGGMNSFEIARFLGISPGTVRERLTRARASLKKEMLAMMSETFEGQRLRVGFTFRIVETIKHIRIRPVPTARGVPWGLSVATGIIIAVLSLGQHLSFLNPVSTPAGLSLPSEAKVLKVGEIPVDVLKISNISIISRQRGNDNGREPDFLNLQNALSFALQGGGDIWTKKTDMPTGRGGPSASTVNGKIYVIGGSIDGKSAIAAVEEYDPAKDKWTKKANMPTARAALSSIVVSSKIYAIGGARFWGDSLSTVEEYDPAKDKWTKKSDMPTTRAWFSASTVNGKIYAIGGDNGFNFLSIVEEYDPATDKWTKKVDMPTARGWLSASALNGKIYVIGGGSVGAMLSTVEEYDPATGKWTKKSDMPTARNALSTSAVCGKIYAIGGEDSGGNHVSIVEEYDPVTDTWTKKADMLTTREALSTSVVSGKIYAIGGAIDFGVIFSTVEEYDTGLIDESKSIETTGKLPTTWSKIRRAVDN